MSGNFFDFPCGITAHYNILSMQTPFLLENQWLKWLGYLVSGISNKVAMQPPHPHATI